MRVEESAFLTRTQVTVILKTNKYLFYQSFLFYQMNFLNNYIRSSKSSKQTHFSGLLEKTDKKATSVQLTILLSLKTNRCITSAKRPCTFWILERGKGEGDKNIVEKLQEQDQGRRPSSEMMDSIFYTTASKRWEEGTLGFLSQERILDE